ncbi:hypothetical protein ABPG74_001310 [Tetrahymena malaccensis]
MNSKPRVQIYGADWCPYCNNAQKLFTNLNVKYEYIDTDKHPEKKQELYKQLNWDTIPMIFIDGKFEGGYSDVQTKLKSGKYQFDEEED